MAVSVLPPFQGSFCYFPFSFSTTLVIPVKYTLDHSYTTSTTIHSYPVTIEVVPTAKKGKNAFGIFFLIEKIDSPILVSAYVQLTPTDSKIHPIVEQNSLTTFTKKENNKGYSRFLEFKTLESIKKTHTFSDGYHFLINFSIPTALWKDSCVHESRQRTCCLGLCNQGATCYLNSALQLLYWTPLFRKGVYHLESKSDIPRTLQKLFFDLQTSAHPPTTQNLTKAFGWTSNDVMVQQDTQEFLRVLFDVLEKKMDETLKIFSGSIAHCIECDGFKSETNEEFSDLSVDVDGCKTLNDSFKKYFATEKLSGENKYRTPDGKLKDAVKSSSIKKAPKVLLLHLKRFTMDFTQNRAIKISSPLQFDKTLDLSKFCDEENVKYEIFGVLIHSGGCYGGHYYAYIRPCPSMDFWIECNDSNVRIAPWKNVYEEGVGIGGTTGYLLAYVRIESVQEIFCNINRSDISGALWEQRSQDWVNWKEEYSSRSKISSSSVVSSSTNYGSTNNVKRIGESYSLHPSKTSKHVQQHDVLQKFNIILSTEFTTTGLDPDSPKHIQLSLPTTTTTKGVIDFITKKYSLENKKVIIFKLGRPVHEIRKSSSYLKSVVNQQPFVVVIDPLNAATNRVMAYIKGEIERSVVFVGKLDEELEKIVDIKPVLFDDSTTIKDLKKVTGFSGDVHALTNLLEKYQKVDDRQVLSSTTHVAKTLFSLNTNYKIISLNSYILPLFVIGKDIVNFYSKKYLGIVVHCNPSPAPFQPIQTPIVDITILKNDTIEILITTLASQIQQPLHHIYLTRLPKASYNSYFSRKVVDFFTECQDNDVLNLNYMVYPFDISKIEDYTEFDIQFDSQIKHVTFCKYDGFDGLLNNVLNVVGKEVLLWKYYNNRIMDAIKAETYTFEDLRNKRVLYATTDGIERMIAAPTRREILAGNKKGRWFIQVGKYISNNSVVLSFVLPFEENDTFSSIVKKIRRKQRQLKKLHKDSQPTKLTTPPQKDLPNNNISKQQSSSSLNDLSNQKYQSSLSRSSNNPSGEMSLNISKETMDEMKSTLSSISQQLSEDSLKNTPRVDTEQPKENTTTEPTTTEEINNLNTTSTPVSEVKIKKRHEYNIYIAQCKKLIWEYELWDEEISNPYDSMLLLVRVGTQPPPFLQDQQQLPKMNQQKGINYKPQEYPIYKSSYSSFTPAYKPKRQTGIKINKIESSSDSDDEKKNNEHTKEKKVNEEIINEEKETQKEHVSNENDLKGEPKKELENEKDTKEEEELDTTHKDKSSNVVIDNSGNETSNNETSITTN